jgi:hypothetical protein
MQGVVHVKNIINKKQWWKSYVVPWDDSEHAMKDAPYSLRRVSGRFLSSLKQNGVFSEGTMTEINWRPMAMKVVNSFNTIFPELIILRITICRI